MISLEDALRDQTDLRRLCAPVPDRTNPANNSYGFAGILNDYVGYATEKPVPAVIPHGVYLDAALMLDQEMDLPFRAVLNYPQFRAAAWASDGERLIIPSASPFLYARDMFVRRFPDAPRDRGTIFFAAHTVQTLRTNADWSAVARELTRLGDEYQPVDVCLHFVDYLKGLSAPFERAGLRVVCAGRGDDPQFVYRLLHLMSFYRRACSHDVGGAVLYATAAGLPVFLLSDIVRQLYDPAVFVAFGRIESEQAGKTKTRLVEMFRDDSPSGREALEEVVSYLLGAENLKSPDDLREDLGHAETLPLLAT